jgi:ABC-type branched-subunit amino acid transport system ATPase component
MKTQRLWKLSLLLIIATLFLFGCASKSTVFKALYGFTEVRQGRILFDNRNITTIRPQDALKSGITIIPQLRCVFPQMSVKENLEMGVYLERDKKRVQRQSEYIFDLFPRLAERAKQKVGTMSGGEQRMLEIGRALMWEPKLVLMDEPSAGLAPLITKSIFRGIRQLNDQIGLTVLMIEQNARQGLEISDRGYVLELGRNSYEGAGDELPANDEVRRAFLGGHQAAAIANSVLRGTR